MHPKPACQTHCHADVSGRLVSAKGQAGLRSAVTQSGRMKDVRSGGLDPVKSKRRSWLFIIGAPYLMAVPLGLWALLYPRLPLTVNRVCTVMALLMVVAYVGIGVFWSFSVFQSERRR